MGREIGRLSRCQPFLSHGSILVDFVEAEGCFGWFPYQAAKAADARAVVVFGYNEGSEGVDRPSIALPGDQDALIQAVVETNSRSVVVLNTGDPVSMPWVNSAEAILQMWYPGQVGGWATAGVLLENANPGGKLPVPFPASDDDTQVYVGPSSEVPAEIEMAEKALVAFERFSLKNGDWQDVALHVAPRWLSYWDADADQWVVAGGSREVFVGSSSRDIRLQGTVDIES